MKKSGYFLHFLTFCILSSPRIGWTGHGNIKMGFIKSQTTASKELDAVCSFLQGQKIETEILDWKSLKMAKSGIQDFHIIWYHKPDSLDFEGEAVHPQVIQTLQMYVKGGGSLLLTQDALRYLLPLGIETEEPESRTVETKDEGYGRKRGLHAFLKHPMFSGLHGGAEIFAPVKDMSVRQVGFFGERLPKKGKVVAVDWAYIRFRENSKLVLEYTVDKGKVIAIGAYTDFTCENKNRLHLEHFLINTINYLTGRSEEKDVFYWQYDSLEVIPFQSTVEKIATGASTQWDLTNPPLSITAQSGTNRDWDVAGQRILVMGNEHGGIREIWAHPLMAFRDYEVGISYSSEDSIIWLKHLPSEIRIQPESVIRTYQIGEASLTEVIIVSPNKPLGIIHYEYEGKESALLTMTWKSSYRLMWPYSEKVLGPLYTSWDSGTNGYILKEGRGKYVSMLCANRKPTQNLIGRYEKFERVDNRFEGIRTDSFIAGALLQYTLKPHDQMDVIFCASEQGMKRCYEFLQDGAANPEKVFDEAVATSRDFLKSCLMVTTPEADFNEGYRWALYGTDRFYVHTPDLGRAFVAGYATTASGWDGGHAVNGRPGYAWYFGRDAAWSGFATLDYGDFEKIRSQLYFFNRFQDLKGKIFHELTTSGALHFDAADATPLYLILAGKYLRHSGDLKWIRESWPHIQAAIDFCCSTDTDGDHLIENTDVGHGWIEGGKLYGAHTTLYLASCWAAALDETAGMASALGFHEKAEKYKTESQKVRDIINREFWNPEDGFYFYGKNKEGSFNPEQTVLPAIPLYFQQADKDKADSVLKHYAENGFTTDWGVRILQENSPLFNPRGYHYGSVWPLFTGWTALAEYRYNRGIQGYSHIMNNLLVYKHWSRGYVEEVLNGAEYKPSGVCRHQCWSESMVIQPIIEGMLGIQMDAVKKRLTLEPQIPAHWDSLKVENIRMGDQNIHLNMHRIAGKLSYSLQKSDTNPVEIIFRPSLPVGSRFDEVTINGRQIKPILRDSHHKCQLDFVFKLSSKIELEIHYRKGIEILPVIPHPEPGDLSRGLRIISDSWEEGSYSVMLQGHSGMVYVCRIFYQDQIITSVKNGRLLNQKDAVADIEVQFEESASKYQFKNITLNLKDL